MSTELDAAERMAAVKAHITLDGNEEGTEYSIATSRHLPWHEFGANFTEDMTIDQALTASHTDTVIVAQDLSTQFVHTDANGEPTITELVSPDRTARITTNPYTGAPVYLGTVGRGLPIVQNREVLEWGYDILGAIRGGDNEKGLITSVGTFKQQRKFFTTLTLPQHILVGGKDPVGLYLSLLEHHDGEGALTAVISAVRFECRNTTRIGIRNAVSTVKLTHTSGLKSRMTQVRHLLDVSEDYAAAFQAEMDKMWDRDLLDLEFEQMVSDIELFGTRKPDPEKAGKASVTSWDKQYAMVLAQRTDPVNAGSRPGSAYNAFQAVVSFDNYDRRVQGKEDADKQAERAGRVLLGANDRVESKALAFLTR